MFNLYCKSLLVGAVVLSSAAQCAEISLLSAGAVSYAVCTVDLQKDKLSTFWKSDKGQPYGSLEELSTTLNSVGRRLVCGTNAGIFDESQRPLGLYIESGRELHRLNIRRNAYGNFYMEPNGVFMIRGSVADIVTTAEFQALPDEDKRRVEYATQSGPMLLHNGEINSLFAVGSPNTTTRNAVCIKTDKNIALVTALDPVNFYNFAQFLKARMACQSALYMDGTVSSFYPYRRFEIRRQLGPLLAVTAALP